MKTSLVIMAAGIGSRFGGGIKQLEPIGPNGEIIMDYSIHDAVEAGFNKIVFIIRKDIEEDFKEIIGKRIEKVCNGLGVETAYCFQNPDDLPYGITNPADRKKPWGTGHAVLACKDIVKESFAVINADDYYGKEGYRKIHEFLVSEHPENEYCMAGFILKNTLSENGGVTRGICKKENGYLTDVVETSDIVKTAEGASVNGVSIDPESNVSMNMWGLTPAFMGLLEKGFVEFFENIENPLKSEYLLPIYIGELLRDGKISVKVLETEDKWFGVTYREDKELVVSSMKKLIENGLYKTDLYSDL